MRNGSITESVEALQLVLGTGPGNPPAGCVQTKRTGWFGCRLIQKPDPLPLDGSNPDPYLPTRVYCQVWLDPSVPMSCSAFWVFLFMVAFWYRTDNCTILTMVMNCHFLIYRQPLYSKQVQRRSLPHPENERHWSVDNWWSCILGNRSGA